MKKLFILLLIASMILILVTPVSSDDTKQPLDQTKIINIQGNVQAIMTSIQAPRSGEQGVPLAFIKLKIYDKNLNKEHFVQLAPGNFLRLKGLFLKKEDHVKIRVFSDQSSPELKPLGIEKDGRMFILRDEFGRGLWNKTELQKQFREGKRNTNR